MNIKPGDEVVCVDDTTLPEQYLGIRAGETYTATWVGMCRTYLGGDYAGIRLAGVNRGVCPQFGEEDPPFALRRFKPVVKPTVKEEKKVEEPV
ncbi:hypothetical protein [Agrobacterium pusense]|uniref:hypothetical protein n=1 Tax=Agrobacterium pusense TaxID=648995 RepID=UPI000D1A8D49|nr:hypothetical protein [Agrobacterium pusense]